MADEGYALSPQSDDVVQQGMRFFVDVEDQATKKVGEISDSIESKLVKSLHKMQDTIKKGIIQWEGYAKSLRDFVKPNFDIHIRIDKDRARSTENEMSEAGTRSGKNYASNLFNSTWSFLKENWGKIISVIGITAVVSKAIGPFLKYLEVAMGPVISALQEVFVDLGRALRPVFTALEAPVRSLMDAIRPMIPELVSIMMIAVDVVKELLPIVIVMAQIGMSVAKWMLQLMTIKPVLYTIIGLFVAYKTVLAIMAIVTWTQIAALTALKVITGVVTAVQWALNAAMLANPIGLIIISVAALIGALILLVKYFKPITEFLWKMGEPFRKFFIGVWEGIKGFFSNIWGFILQFKDYLIAILFPPYWLKIFWDAFGGTITNVFSRAWDTVKNIFNSAKDWIFKWLNPANWFKAFSGWMTGISDYFVKNLPRPLRWLLGKLGILKAEPDNKEAEKSGQATSESFAKGISSMKGTVAIKTDEMMKPVADRMPHSDALTGPLSKLTKSGQALPETMAKGIKQGSPALKSSTESMLEGLSGFVSTFFQTSPVGKLVGMLTGIKRPETPMSSPVTPEEQAAPVVKAINFWGNEFRKLMDRGEKSDLSMNDTLNDLRLMGQ